MGCGGCPKQVGIQAGQEAQQPVAAPAHDPRRGPFRSAQGCPQLGQRTWSGPGGEAGPRRNRENRVVAKLIGGPTATRLLGEVVGRNGARRRHHAHDIARSQMGRSNHDWRRRLVRRRPLAPCTGPGRGKIALGRRCRIPEAGDSPAIPTALENSPESLPTRPFQCAGQTGGDSHGNRLGNSAAVSRSRGRNRLAWDGLARRGLLRFAMGRMVGSLLLEGAGGETTIDRLER